MTPTYGFQGAGCFPPFSQELPGFCNPCHGKPEVSCLAALQPTHSTCLSFPACLICIQPIAIFPSTLPKSVVVPKTVCLLETPVFSFWGLVALGLPADSPSRYSFRGLYLESHPSTFCCQQLHRGVCAGWNNAEGEEQLTVNGLTGFTLNT